LLSAEWQLKQLFAKTGLIFFSKNTLALASIGTACSADDTIGIKTEIKIPRHDRNIFFSRILLDSIVFGPSV
jgi:hypothetical protein